MNSYKRFGYYDAMFAAKHISTMIEEKGLDAKNIKDGIILGSGLGNFAEKYLNADEDFYKRYRISFDEIFDLMEIPRQEKKKKVAGHAQEIIIGPVNGLDENRLVIAQSGREHLYEGTEPCRAVFWLRVMQILGVETLIGSNASGIITPHALNVPSLMLVSGDIEHGKENALKGPNDERLGPRFPNLGDLYTAEIRSRIKVIAKELGIDLKEGIYIRESGPNYENPEMVYDMRQELDDLYRQGRRQPGEDRFQGEPLGVVGMSSTYEARVAKHASQSKKHPAFQKARVFISAATNYAAGLGPNGFGAFPSHEEVKENAAKLEDEFGKLVQQTLKSFRPAG